MYMYCSNVGHEYRRVGATFVHYLITTEYRCTPRVYMYIVHLDGYISKKKIVKIPRAVMWKYM